MQDYKLVIECIFKIPNRSFSFFSKPKFPIQNEIFEIGLKIKNIGDNVFPGARFKGLRVRSAESKGIYEQIDKEFSISEVNPGEEKQIWMGKMTTYLAGLVWISGDVEPQEAGTQRIITFQKERGTNQSVNPSTNSWGNSHFIQSTAERESGYTNFLILLLTILLFLETLVGLKKIAIFCLSLIGGLFSFIGTFITSLVG